VQKSSYRRRRSEIVLGDNRGIKNVECKCIVLVSYSSSRDKPNLSADWTCSLQELKPENLLSFYLPCAIGFVGEFLVYRGENVRARGSEQQQVSD
jgi:hypothetical protein